MRVFEGNLLYDDQNPECFKIVTIAQGQHYAFVQLVDTSAGNPKRYWGVWHFDDEEESMLEIIRCGGKWPDLQKG